MSEQRVYKRSPVFVKATYMGDNVEIDMDGILSTVPVMEFEKEYVPVDQSIPFTVQDFIVYGTRLADVGTPLTDDPGDESYARFVLLMHDVPATLSFDIENHRNEFKLYCTYNGERNKVIGVSRLGDVFLASDLNATSYDKRVPVSQCSQFSKEKEYETI